jgi:hypothetical protein
MKTSGCFEDYRLIVEWRWPERSSNSGILLHVNGSDEVWPRCVQAQLKSSRAGDIILIGVGTGAVIDGERKVVENARHPYYALDRREASSEHAIGEWNRYEIVAEGDRLEVTVNGIVQNKVTELTLTDGHIAIQSEGLPIEIRTFTVESLE